MLNKAFDVLLSPLNVKQDLMFQCFNISRIYKATKMFSLVVVVVVFFVVVVVVLTRIKERLTDGLTLLRMNKGLGTNACRATVLGRDRQTDRRPTDYSISHRFVSGEVLSRSEIPRVSEGNTYLISSVTTRLIFASR